MIASNYYFLICASANYPIVYNLHRLPSFYNDVE